MQKTIYSIFLKFGQIEIIYPILIVGYIFYSQKIFRETIVLLLISIIYSFVLKCTFAKPLLPWLGDGFAFPSGHMTITIVFYGWLALRLRNLYFWAFAAIVTIGEAVSIVHFRYHDHNDILGAFFFTVPLIYIYWILLQKKIIKNTHIFISATLMLAYINFQHKIPEHIWGFYYCLIGFLFWNAIAQKYQKQICMKYKMIATICCAYIAILVSYLCLYLDNHQLHFAVSELPFLILGAGIPVSIYCCSMLSKALVTNNV